MTKQDSRQDDWRDEHAAMSKKELEEILVELEVVASSPSKVSSEAQQALKHAGDIVDGDRSALFAVIEKLADPVDIGDAAIYAARLLEAAFTIGVYAGQSEGARELARRLEDTSRPQRRTRQLGIQQRIIEALEKIYPGGDPLEQGLSRSTVRRAVAQDLGVAEGLVSLPTLDRARTAIWPRKDSISDDV